MYTVVIADDEMELRRAIIERVDWQSAGFEVVGDAENGIEALELIERLEPDLLITDIKMPMMSGLELAKNVRELCPATHIVFLSGYDDFTYAQQAIQYNIIKYLLKPISSEELSEELHKIKAIMDKRIDEIRQATVRDFSSAKRRLAVTEFLLPLLLGASEDQTDEEYLEKKAAELGIIKEGTTPFFGVVITKFKNSENKRCTSERHIGFVDAVLQRYFPTESFFVNGRIVTLIITEDGDIANLLSLPLKELSQRTQKVFSQRCTIGVSRPVKSLSLCAGAYFEAVTARRYTTDGAGDIRYITDQEHGRGSEIEYVEKSVFRLEYLLKVGEAGAIEKFIDELYTEENQGNIDYLIIQILATVYRTVSSVSEKSALPELIKGNPIYAKAGFYDSIDTVRYDITKLCNNAREIISRYQKHDSEILCDKVIEIIENEYGNENLSLTDVSTRLSVSPNYLSALIKKVKKKNFISLLTEKRMKTAYEMIVYSQMKILEIAEKCGYCDQHYFSYCFKKYYGMSPNKMRETERSR